MKARVKATGEIVEIENYDIDKLGKLKYFTEDFDSYDENEVEIILERAPDYWTRLEHQYAGMAMQGFLASGMENTYEYIAEFSANQAHALVEKLKKEEEK